MEAVAHNPAFAKKAGVPQSLGKNFYLADKGRTFNKGDAIMMKKGGMSPAAMAEMTARRRPRMGAGMPPSAPPVMPPQPPAPMGMKKGGMPMKDGKPAFMMGKKMNMGGMAGYAKGGNMNAKGSTSGSSRAGENTKIQKKGLTEGRVIKMASGGSVDGIAQRGKTRGKMC